MDDNRITYEEFPNGVVKATITGCRHDALDKINRKFVAPVTASIEITDAWSHAAEKYFMKNTYYAIARCDKEDVYSLEKGKKLAKKRLAEKYNRSIDKRINLFLKHIKQMCENTEEYVSKHTH